MKKFKVLALLLATMGLMASCNNEKANQIDNQGTQTISLKLEQPKTRALEEPVTPKKVTFETVTLHYWKDEIGTIPANPATRLLSAEDIKTATTETDGLKISVGTDVKSVSMTANTSKVKADGADYKVTSVQELGEDFMKKVPMTAPAVKPKEHTNQELNAKLVTLKPVPDLARIEVTGKIEPTNNSTLNKSAYEYVYVDAVYINNYKATKNASELENFDSTASAWKENYPESMHDAMDVNDALSDGKAAGYQVFPAKQVENEDKLPHVVLKIRYKLKDVQEPVTDRWITIVNYKDNDKALTEFVGGKIYKLNLSALNDLFATDDSGAIVDPTDPKPELPKTDLYVTITPYTWTTINITPDL